MITTMTIRLVNQQKALFVLVGLAATTAVSNTNTAWNQYKKPKPLALLNSENQFSSHCNYVCNNYCSNSAVQFYAYIYKQLPALPYTLFRSNSNKLLSLINFCIFVRLLNPRVSRYPGSMLVLYLQFVKIQL